MNTVPETIFYGYEPCIFKFNNFQKELEYTEDQIRTTYLYFATVL